MIAPATHTFQSHDGLTLAYHQVGSGRPALLLHGYISATHETWLRSGAADGLLADGRRLIMPDMRGHGASAKPHDAGAYPPDALIDDVLLLIERLGLTDYDLVGYSLGARIGARLLALGARPQRAIQVPTLVIAGEGDTDRGSVEDLAAALPQGRLRRVGGDHLSALLGPSSETRWPRFSPVGSRRRRGAPCADRSGQRHYDEEDASQRTRVWVVAAPLAQPC